MNRELLTLNAVPLYGQGTVMDAENDEIPQWETGEETFVSNARAVSVATRGDIDGDVEITVVIGDEPLPGALIFDSIIQLDSGAIEVGNSIAATTARGSLGRPGSYRVRLFAEPEVGASVVGVLVAAEPTARIS
jgi:hypothetical protein